MNFEKFHILEDNFEKPKKMHINRRNFLKAAVAEFVLGYTGAAVMQSGCSNPENCPPTSENTEPTDESEKTEEETTGLDKKDDRIEIGSAELKKLKPELGYEEIYVPQIENLHFPDKVGKYGASTHEGKILRVYRYANITSAVEEKYNLPPGILMAMIMEESTGVDLLPNARGDGGFGLSHMQGSVAKEFGLKTFDGCNSLVCGPKKGSDGKLRIVGCKDENGNPKNHGKALADFMKEHSEDRKALVEADDRLHILLNIDAAGRMMASGIAGPKIEGLGSLRTAIRRYAGKHNYEAYWEDIKRNMGDLNNSEMFQQISEYFDAVNPDLKIDGRSAKYGDYISACFRENENYDLAKYKELPKYKPLNSDSVLNSYEEFVYE